MKIFPAAACLAAVLTAAPALAQNARATECALQADLFGAVADQRRAGKPKATTLRETRAGLTEAAAKYESALEPMVEYIYSLADEHLALDLRTTYREQCMAAG